MIDEKEIIASTVRSGELHRIMIVAKDEGKDKWIARVGMADVMDDLTVSKIVAGNGAELHKKEAIVFFPDLDPNKCVNKDG